MIVRVYPYLETSISLHKVWTAGRIVDNRCHSSIHNISQDSAKFDSELDERIPWLQWGTPIGELLSGNIFN